MGLGPYLQAEFAQTSGRPNDIPIMILIDLGYNWPYNKQTIGDVILRVCIGFCVYCWQTVFVNNKHMLVKVQIPREELYLILLQTYN